MKKNMKLKFTRCNCTRTFDFMKTINLNIYTQRKQDSNGSKTQ